MFITERFSKVVIESWREWDLNPQPTIEFRSDLLTVLSIRPWLQLALTTKFVVLLQFHLLFSVWFHFGNCLRQSPRLFNRNFVEVITWMWRNELIEIVFIFSESDFYLNSVISWLYKSQFFTFHCQNYVRPLSMKDNVDRLMTQLRASSWSLWNFYCTRRLSTKSESHFRSLLTHSLILAFKSTIKKICLLVPLWGFSWNFQVIIKHNFWNRVFYSFKDSS